MRVEILGGYRIISSKSRSAYRFVYSDWIRDRDRAVTFQSLLDRCTTAPENVTV
jgi:hypothetical protein